MRPPLVAVSHGTSSPLGQAAVAALVAAVRHRLPDVHVVDAFVDVQQPRLDTVLAQLARPAVVVPLLLAPGFHVHVDIALAVSDHRATATRVLGPDFTLAAVLRDRLDSVGMDEDDRVILGVAGSRDARAHRSVDRMAAKLARIIGHEVPVGHLGGTGRPIRAVIDEARTTGRRVVVASYLLAPGHFADLLQDCGADAVTSPLLDEGPPDPRLVQLAVERFRVATAMLPMRQAS